MTALRPRRRQSTALFLLLAPLLAIAAGLTGCADMQSPPHAAPAAVTSTPTPTPTLLPATLTPAQLLAMAKPPSGAVIGTAPFDGDGFPLGGTCGAVSAATSYWDAAHYTDMAAQAWLADNPPAGMKVITSVDSGHAPEGDGYVLDAVAGASTQGLTFTVLLYGNDQLAIRVDAVSLPQSAACVSNSVTDAAKAAAANAAAFAAAQKKKPDAAAKQTAQQWAASAVVPPGAVPASTQPAGGLSLESEDWWCAPMATVNRYWTVNGMGVDQTANWLRQHPSPGLVVNGGSAPQPVNPASTLGMVIDMPSASAVEGMVFTVATMPDGVAIRALASAESATVTCLDPPGDGQWAVGG